MSLDKELMVDPQRYDSRLHSLMHTVLDRCVELGAKADRFDPPEPSDDPNAQQEQPAEPDHIEALLRSQANFTPTERAELQLSGALLNVLINVCVARRSSLYHDITDDQDES